MPQKYEMLVDSDLEPLAKKGTIVYDCLKNDYGLSNDDTRMTGIVHVSVTLKSDGNYPYFTVPYKHLRKI